MAWPKEKIDCGIVKIEGKKVKVYDRHNNYTSLDHNHNVERANWVSDGVMCQLSDGSTRVWTTPSVYTNVR